jgi:hypothetical protein
VNSRCDQRVSAAWPSDQRTEEQVTKDWAAVADAIKQRMAEIGLRQCELIDRSNVSPAVVREIQNNVVARKRGNRTLHAISVALDWHPDHLAAVLDGQVPPRLDESGRTEILTRLSAIERRLRAIDQRFAAIRPARKERPAKVRSGPGDEGKYEGTVWRPHPTAE